MGQVVFIWDLEDDPEGNYWHITAYEVPPPGPRKKRKKR